MDWTSIFITLITCAATIITVVIQTRKTSRETQACMEVNDYKTYLLLLLKSYPTKADEIYSVARKYFEDLNGDSFILPIFEDWLDSTGADKPEWFLIAKKKHSH